MRQSATAAIALGIILSAVAAEATIHVDADATGANDGSSWTDAFTDVQAALAAAIATDEIWVAEGSYKPTAGADRTASFTLVEGVSVYGGFAGTETLLAQRNADPATNGTILTGDLNGDDAPAFANRADNSYHVVMIPLLTTAVLDGFTISGGNANGSGIDRNGGGIFLTAGTSTPALANLIVSDNRATQSGGGAYNRASGPSFTRVTFSGNLVVGSSGFNGGPGLNGGGGDSVLGGGIFNDIPTFEPMGTSSFLHCLFIDNAAMGGAGGNGGAGGGAGGSGGSARGGGAYTSSSPLGASSPAFTNCLFLGNLAAGGDRGNGSGAPDGSGGDGFGGAVYNIDSTLTASFTNCAFSGNLAAGGLGINGDGRGGALFNSSTSPVIVNGTFAGNEATSSSAVAEGAAIYASTSFSNPVLHNSILWGNTPDQIAVAGGTLDGASSENLVSGGYAPLPGAVISTADPLFRDADGSDDVAGTLDDDLRLEPASPAIDVGDNSENAEPADLDGNARIVNAMIDLGAYESFYVTFGLLHPALAPHDDDNNDGFSNYDNYASGTDPEGNTVPPPFPDAFESGGNRFFEFTRRTNGLDVFLSYEKTSTLVSWSPMVDGIDYVVDSTSPLGAVREKVTLRVLFDPAVDPRMYWRRIFSTAP